MPLTAEKIIGWHQPGRKAFVLVEEPHASPLGYAELNPMRRDPGHFWLGHAIVRPDLRKRGIGKMFVRALVRHAFERLGAERISLIVFPENTAAVECYRRVGFIPVREEYHEFGTKRTRHRFLRLEIRRSSERSTR
jgi:RimJ/RimL family protein N-acetyltransferase